MKTVKELLKKIIIDDGDGEPYIDIYEVDIKFSTEVDKTLDVIELENWEISLIEDYKMILYCGGDWEESGLKLNIEVVNDELTVTSYETYDEYVEGYSREELLKILK